MNLTKIIVTICSLLFLMVGVDKFLGFLEPPCSLENQIPSTVWTIFGVIQLIAAVLIWIPKYRRGIAVFFFLFMTTFTIVHLVHGTYDIGGSASMAVLLGLLAWNPKLMNKKFLGGT